MRVCPLHPIFIKMRGTEVLPTENGSSVVESKRFFNMAGKICPSPKKLFSPLLRGKVWLIENVEDLFESFGHYVFDHPWRFIIVPTVICLVFSLGFFRRVPELDMERLYSLPVSLTATVSACTLVSSEGF